MIPPEPNHRRYSFWKFFDHLHPENVPVSLGEFEISWAAHSDDGNWSYGSGYEFKTFKVKVNGEKKEKTYRTSTEWRVSSPVQYWKFDELCLLEIEKAKKTRARNLVAVREVRKTQEATSLGITVEDLAKQKQKETQTKRSCKNSEYLVKNTLDRMKILSEGVLPLRREIDELYALMSQDEEFKVIYTDRVLKKLKEAERDIRKITKSFAKSITPKE